MPSILWRVLIAVLACMFTYLLIPPVARIIRLPLGGDVLLVLKVCIAALAVFYILRGSPVVKP